MDGYGVIDLHLTDVELFCPIFLVPRHQTEQNTLHNYAVDNTLDRNVE